VKKSDEPRGWQHSEEFFKRYPTRAARRKFYQEREKLNREIRQGLRHPDGTERLTPHDPYESHRGTIQRMSFVHSPLHWKG